MSIISMLLLLSAALFMAAAYVVNDVSDFRRPGRRFGPLGEEQVTLLLPDDVEAEGGFEGGMEGGGGEEEG
jgi:hypothetical protein